jgi:hypothetical protein
MSSNQCCEKAGGFFSMSSATLFSSIKFSLYMCKLNEIKLLLLHPCCNLNIRISYVLLRLTNIMIDWVFLCCKFLPKSLCRFCYNDTFNPLPGANEVVGSCGLATSCSMSLMHVEDDFRSTNCQGIQTFDPFLPPHFFFISIFISS